MAFGPPTKEGGGVLPGAEMKHPHEPESIPLDRVRKKGKKEAAPAATHLDIQGKGVRGFDTKHIGAERERSGKKREKADRRQDALRRILTVAFTPDLAIVWGARAVRVHLVPIAGLRLGRPLQGEGLGAQAAQR